tara:strand:- start:838 stop:1335 length:498 start_codon:yes stop_codon:yes gene_type:complete
MPTFTIELADAFIAKVRGNEMTFDMTRMTEASVKSVFDYGMQRYVNDAAGGKDEDHVANANAKFEALITGEVRRRGTGSGMSEFDSAVWDVIETLIRNKVMGEQKLTKVKELTDAHKANIAERTEKAFGAEAFRTHADIVAKANAAIEAKRLKAQKVTGLDLSAF